VDKVLAAQDWIRQRLNHNISITTWASACGLNADYFSRLFKAHTGLTPKSWLIEARLQRAARLLSGSGRTVAEVADLYQSNL
jgi:AraC-like DNA-binding protein